MVQLTGDHVPGGLELPSEHVLDGACPLLPGAQWSPDSDLCHRPIQYLVMSSPHWPHNAMWSGYICSLIRWMKCCISDVHMVWTQGVLTDGLHNQPLPACKQASSFSYTLKPR